MSERAKNRVTVSVMLELDASSAPVVDGRAEVSVDWSRAAKQSCRLDRDVRFMFTAPPPNLEWVYLLLIQDDVGDRNAEWVGSDIYWADGSRWGESGPAPILSRGSRHVDIVQFSWRAERQQYVAKASFNFS